MNSAAVDYHDWLAIKERPHHLMNILFFFMQLVAHAILAVSLAVCKAGAEDSSLPGYLPSHSIAHTFGIRRSAEGM